MWYFIVIEFVFILGAVLRGWGIYAFLPCGVFWLANFSVGFTGGVTGWDVAQITRFLGWAELVVGLPILTYMIIRGPKRQPSQTEPR
jgi:hypothetical protein